MTSGCVSPGDILPIFLISQLKQSLQGQSSFTSCWCQTVADSAVSAVFVMLGARSEERREEEQQEVGGSTWLLPRHLQAVERERRGETARWEPTRDTTPHQSCHVSIKDLFQKNYFLFLYIFVLGYSMGIVTTCTNCRSFSYV